MRGLIANLLDVSSIEAGTLTLAPEPTRVALLVDRARTTLPSGGIRHSVLVELAPGLPLAMADREHIVQVLNSLFSNAGRHPPESSPIRVEAARNVTHVAISVSDEGGGLPRPVAGPVPRTCRPQGVHRPRAGDFEGSRRGAMRPHPHRERRAGPRCALHVHAPGRGRRTRSQRVRPGAGSHQGGKRQVPWRAARSNRPPPSRRCCACSRRMRDAC